MEEEAERIYKDERGLLLDDEAASTRDAMSVLLYSISFHCLQNHTSKQLFELLLSIFFFGRYEQAEFIERELEQMTEQIKTIIQTLNSNQVMLSF